MSRHEADLVAAAEAEIDVGQVLDALGQGGAAGVDRFRAMARYLSGAANWDEAGGLDGTFGGFTAVTGLTGAKEQ